MKHGFIVMLAVILATGCATYVPPGEKADLLVFAPPDIKAGLEVQPSNPFPASVAVVRVQSPSYSNYNLKKEGGTYGSGRYSVILTQEVNEDSQLEKVDKLDNITEVVSLNRLLLPERLESDREIRAAASRLQAGLVFLYTFDTSFFDTISTENNIAKPLSVISLGLSPARKIYAATACTALLLDTRTGYIYAAYEENETTQLYSTSWGSSDAADQARRSNEEKSFVKLIDGLIATWPDVLARHGLLTEVPADEGTSIKF